MHIPQAEHHKYCGRAGGVQFKQVRYMLVGRGARPRTSPTARAWVWLGDRCKELAGLTAAAKLGAVQHRRRLIEKLQGWRPPFGATGDAEIWQCRRRRLYSASRDELALWALEATEQGESEERRFLVLKRAALQNRARGARMKGASSGHRFARQPDPWHADPCVEHGEEGGGVVPAELCDRLQLLVDEWAGRVWRCDEAPPSDADWGPMGNPLPKPPVADVRSAAKSFPERTGLSGDGWHPRHFAHLSNDSLHCWVEVMYAAELMGKIPDIFHFLMVVFIPKPLGGVRPIGLFTASLRLWGRIRRPVARAMGSKQQPRVLLGWPGQSPRSSACGTRR